MRVLSLVHQPDAASGVFADAAADAGHELDEWLVPRRKAPPAPLEDYGAVLVFGGAMHVDQEDRHRWLRDELELLRGLLANDVPLLGVCLGGQLLAKALDAPVRLMPSPEVGWFDVALTPEAADDPVFGELPGRFSSFQWHSYAFELPQGAVPLARNERCLQAFRAGESAWGIQFHAEVGPVRRGVGADLEAGGRRYRRPPAPGRREPRAHRGVERVREEPLRAVPRGRGTGYAGRRDHSCHDPA